MTAHLLAVARIEDEGTVEFDIVCPAGEGEACPAAEDGWVSGVCVVANELFNIGAEIVRGEALGPGPWPVKLTYEGSGEDAEAYLDLLPVPVSVVVVAVLSV